MSDTFTIRHAKPDDAPSVAAIHVASWRATYRGSLPDAYLGSLTIEQRLPMWEQILASPSPLVRVWVAERADDMVGFCSVGPPLSQAGEPHDSLVLHTIYLEPGYERHGIGSALLQHAEREVIRLGATVMTLWVLRENQGARRFYEAAGWQLDGAEKLNEIGERSVREVRYSKRLS